MFRIIIFSVLISCVLTENVRVVELDDGAVVGNKYWKGDFYEFYGVPYATAPTGRDKFKAPLPVTKREKTLAADAKDILCQQIFFTDDDDDDTLLQGEEDCLILNLLVPKIASESNLVPVVVYLHSGAFAGGSGNMGNLNYVARHDVIAISLNYRLGAIGFACLGTEEIPGNAALKDQVAALRWINSNIHKFGGDRRKVTLAGYSVGAAMAELIALSDATEGLIDKLILESGSALSPFAVNRDPISTARNIARSIGYNGSGTIEDLNEFYLNAPVVDITKRSLNFFLPNSTFGFAPCIEKKSKKSEAILTESPLESLSKKETKYAVLTGLASMEGLSRSIKFETWMDLMNENFSDFLPADLTFKDDKSKNEVADLIKEYYFKGEELSHDTLQEYIDYFSDSMFRNSILKSARLHAARSKRPLYFYEFSYVGDLNMKHYYMDKIKGASHRDQTSYILDFYGFTHHAEDMNIRDLMTFMWTDFVKYENPTTYESLIVKQKWQKYTNEEPKYLSIGTSVEMRTDPFKDSYAFWNKLYEKYYWSPIAP
ncbi:esterase FE4-like [Plodia interpunctella]|uniref:esterase FE4-like n=1 Tax=Plodia interpunctella TaxID=58824 RepID=UPI002368AEB0|nr:esterase FE4-like [Plodia interpunctella]